jgi:G6PDH family F420-dependent oxidoreductase
MVAASGASAAALAGETGDGLISTSPDSELIQSFESAGGNGKPRYGQMTVCWAADEAEARRTAHKYWPNSAISGELGQELPLPRHFEQAAQMVTEDDVAQSVVCGPDSEPYVQKIQEYEKAGFDHVYLHQVGPDQQGFFEFFKRELRPRLR